MEEGINAERVARERSEEAIREELAGLPAFEDIPIPRGKLEFDPDACEAGIRYLFEHHDIAYYWEMGPSHSVKTLLKRAVRKALKCLMVPMLERQNQLNARYAGCIAYLREQVEALRRQAWENERRAAEALAAQEEARALRQRVAELEARLGEGEGASAPAAIRPDVQSEEDAPAKAPVRGGDPIRVVQVLPTMSYGDAVGNDAFAIDGLLRQKGVDAQIYAERIDPRLPEGAVLPLRELRRLSDADVLIYHGSTGMQMDEKLPLLGGRKMMIYHNVTPPEFFRAYSCDAERKTASGLREIRKLAPLFDYCIADSAYNRADLRRMGYTCPIDVCPILLPLDDYRREPNEQIMRVQGRSGYVNLLFVGRVAPNKRHEDVIRAFYLYHNYFEPHSRLFLVGAVEKDKYILRLQDYVRALGLDGSVFFKGQVQFDELLAYYRTADAFVCMSEHEGFCVPLVEAMLFDVPVVARDCAAVGETLGDGGVLLKDVDPMAAARAIDGVIRDRALRERVLARQRARLADFAYGKVSATLWAQLGGFIGGENA